MCSGPIVVPSTVPAPTFSRPTFAGELLDELVGDRLVDVEALDGEAGLAAVEEAADARRADGGVDVGVVEDDHRIGAAELERHALHASRGELGDVLSDRRRPGERDLRDSRVGDEGLAEHRPLAGDDLEDVLREPASCMISAIRSVVSGVVSAGFATTALPQTSAGPSLLPSSVVGKFQGTIATTTPSGRLRTSPCVRSSRLGTYPPRRLFARPA